MAILSGERDPSQAPEAGREPADSDGEPQAPEVVGEVVDGAAPASSEPVAGGETEPGEVQADAEEAAEEPQGAAAAGEAEASEATEIEAEEPEAEEPESEEEREALVRSVGALLFASVEPLGVARLQALLEEPSAGRVRRALRSLAERLDAVGAGVLAREIGGGWRLVSDPETAPVVGRLFQSRKSERISQAGLETLAIIAYRQPVTKGEIEAIRGVQAGPVLRSLVDRGLVRVTGRAEQPGAPLLYGTTRTFLDRFGLARLEDLPRDAELARD